MTRLMFKAIEKIETLSAEIQDEIAEQLRENLENELAWQKTLAKPQPNLRKLAKQAVRAVNEGKTKRIG